MNKFIKLSNTIINTSKITKVISYPNNYSIHMVNNNCNGIFFYLFGTIDSRPNTIEIYKDTTPKDYEIVKKWIDSIED